MTPVVESLTHDPIIVGMADDGTDEDVEEILSQWDEDEDGTGFKVQFTLGAAMEYVERTGDRPPEGGSPEGGSPFDLAEAIIGLWRER